MKRVAVFETRNCLICNKEFIFQKRKSNPRGQIYCSRECRNRSRIGATFSQEHKERIKATRQRKSGIPYNCLYCGKPCIDMECPSEPRRQFCSRACMGLAKKGQPFPAECLRKAAIVSKTKTGDKSHRWKGGATRRSSLLRGRKDMEDWKKSVLKRDAFQCGFCGADDKKVQADHIRPMSLYPELRHDLANGQALCEECHRKKN